MDKLLVVFVIIIGLFITGCASQNQIDTNDLNEYDVQQTFDEVTENDFVFRLTSEKETYKVGEEVKLSGELEYIGDRPEVTIVHSASVIQFPMTEKVRDYYIDSAVAEIGVTKELQSGDVIKESFAKSGGYTADDDPKDYKAFIADYLEGEHYNIHATVYFKVVD